MSFSIRPAHIDDIDSIRQIAAEVWPVAYREILSPKQLSYMLNLFYSAAALEEQMCLKGHRFFLASHNGDSIGFASFSKVAENAAHLHKLYVLPGSQGSGIGHALLARCEEEAAKSGPCRMQLNVNRNNRARQFYEAHGYAIILEEDIDIGHGFFMNDYRMEKNLEKA